MSSDLFSAQTLRGVILLKAEDALRDNSNSYYKRQPGHSDLSLDLLVTSALRSVCLRIGTPTCTVTWRCLDHIVVHVNCSCLFLTFHHDG